MEEEEVPQPLATQRHNAAQLDGEEDSCNNDDEDAPDATPKKPRGKKDSTATPSKSVLDSEDDDFEVENDDSELEVDLVPLKDISIFNSLDFHLQMTVKEPKWRIEQWKASVHFLKQYAFAGKKFGRIWCRRLLAGILVDLNSQPAYGENPQQMKKGSIVSWTKDVWRDLMHNLKAAQTACRRKDRNLVVLRNSDSANRSTEDLKFLNSARLNRILSICQANEVLAPIRCRIEMQILAGKTGAPVVNDEKTLAVFESIGQSNNPVVLEYCLKLFRRKEKSDANAYAEKENDSVESGVVDDKMNPQLHEPVLKNLEELRTVLKAKPFDLNWLVNKFEKVINEWHDGSLANSVLQAYNYSGRTAELPHTTQGSGANQHRQADLSGLKRSRAALNNNHGEDPLDESREIAKECTGVAHATRAKSSERRKKQRQEMSTNSPPTPKEGAADANSKEKSPARGTRFYEEQKVTSRLSFSEDESDDKSQRSPKRAKLSEVSPQRRLSPAGPKAVRNGTVSYYNGPPPDEGVFDEFGNVTRRIPWSVDETSCIIAALQRDKSLVGNWVEIKNMYGHQLRNRSTVQIKDKFRNLQKTHALDFLTYPEPEQEQEDGVDEEIEDEDQTADC